MKAIYPGSFDPITNGHLDVLKRALKVFDTVIILVANNEKKASRFSTLERMEMIKDAVKGLRHVKVDFTNGLTVDYANKHKIKNLIRGLRNETDYTYEVKLSKEYKKVDPEINMTFFIASDEFKGISSSKIHKLGKAKKDISKYVPQSVVKMYKKG